MMEYGSRTWIEDGSKPALNQGQRGNFRATYMKTCVFYTEILDFCVWRPTSRLRNEGSYTKICLSHENLIFRVRRAYFRANLHGSLHERGCFRVQGWYFHARPVKGFKLMCYTEIYTKHFHVRHEGSYTKIRFFMYKKPTSMSTYTRVYMKGDVYVYKGGISVQDQSKASNLYASYMEIYTEHFL